MLSERNFRKWIADLQAAMRRCDKLPRRETMQATYCELIGNVCWHFAPDEAGEWFKRSLELRRAVNWEPNVTSARLLWKLSDQDGLRAEGLKAIEAHETRVSGLKARELPTDQFKAREQEASLRLALHELAVLHFLLEDFPKALEWSAVGLQEDTRWSEWDKPRGQTPSSVYVFVRDASKAILDKDAASYKRALATLRSQIEMWPTDAGNMVSELYRHGLWLGQRHFPGAELEP